jgi:D-hydroxyproline dehydrogenase subunit alpha
MNERYAVDVAVVGGGPAGLAAATAAGRSGATALLVDAFSQVGGQYFMQPLAGTDDSEQIRRGRAAIAEARAGGVTLLTGVEIFAAYPGFRLFGAGGGRSILIDARAVIAANGAHDRVMAFPGWTLPRVMTAGAGQRLAKLNGVLPGKRVVIAGSGVFLWAVAQTLLDKGAEIVALVEARQPSFALGSHLLAFPERWREAAGLYRSVSVRVKRLIFGKLVAKAIGSGRVDEIVLCDPKAERRETISGFDALLVSHGFQPNIETTSLLDCAHRFDDALGGWHALVDDDGRTSASGLFAVGEVAGVAGYRPAALSGQLAGIAAAADLGLRFGAAGSHLDRLRKELARAKRFGHGLGKLFAPLTELQRFAKDDTILCRCEEVTRGEILAAVREGSDSIHAAKMWTRTGMGRCQGRMCRMSVVACISEASGRPSELIGYNRPRTPCRPVALEDALLAFEQAVEL